MQDSGTESDTESEEEREREREREEERERKIGEEKEKINCQLALLESRVKMMEGSVSELEKMADGASEAMENTLQLLQLVSGSERLKKLFLSKKGAMERKEVFKKNEEEEKKNAKDSLFKLSLPPSKMDFVVNRAFDSQHTERHFEFGTSEISCLLSLENEIWVAVSKNKKIYCFEKEANPQTFKKVFVLA